MTSIESFLRLSEKEVEKRMDELLRKVPTFPGTEYLKTRAKKFKVQPWPFIIYLAYYDPSLLQKGLEEYKGYDGAENYHAIVEQLREYHIMWECITKLQKQES